MTKSRTPVSSFGPELLAALREGSSAEVIFDLPSKELATRFKARLNALRAAMRKEDHPLAAQVMRAGIRSPSDNACRVILAPRDSEFASALKRASVEVDLFLPRAQTPLPGTSPDPASDFLSTIIGERSEKGVDKP